MNDELAAVVKSIEKTFGSGVLCPASRLKPREYRGSGSIALDIALGGGWGKAAIVDVIGKPSAGKTLLFEMAAVQAQRTENRPSVLYDFEGTHDPRRFIALGGDPDGLYLVRAENFGTEVDPMFLEWASDMLKVMLKTNAFACIGMDSTAAMVSKAEYEIKEAKGEEAATMAYTARGMSSLLRQIVGTGLLARSDSTVFFMSQLRDNIGARGFRGAPPPDKRTGGRALPFYAAVQIEVSRGDVFKADVEQEGGYIEKDVPVGGETKVRVRKNKLNAKQGRVASFALYTEGEVRGIDRLSELTDLAILSGVVKKSGSWYDFEFKGGNAHLQGKAAVQNYLAQYSHVAADIEAQTRRVLDLHQQATALAPEVVYGDAEEDEDEELMRRMDEREREREALSETP